MKLIDIDKTLYRKRLNIVIVAFIASLTLLALLFGSVLISLFAAPITEPAVSNFRFNLMGVILALISCLSLLHFLKQSDFFVEVYYVWQLKQCQNSIFRRLKKIKLASEQGDVNAITTLKFYYLSLQKVYLLDDNTLTITTINKKLSDLENLILDKNLIISPEQFEKSMLRPYK